MWRRTVTGGPGRLLPTARAAAAEAVRRGVATERRWQVELAVHELLANARAHGHRDHDDLPIHIEVAAGDDGQVRVQVGDAALGGTWPVPAPEPAPAVAPERDGGNGLRLVHAFADQVTVAQRPGRTVVILHLAVTREVRPAVTPVVDTVTEGA